MNAPLAARRTVLISGASSGIGRATALRLAQDGYQVLAGVRRLQDAPRTPDGAAGSISPIVLDVASAESVASARDSVAQLLDGRPLTALVNNAGIGALSPMRTVDPDVMRDVWEVNVLGVVRLTQAMLPLMSSGSRLLVVGSIGDRLTMPFGGPLTSSKWAVASVAEAFRLELAADGIAVTIVEPGSIHSDAVGKVEAGAAATARQIEGTDPGLAKRFERAAKVAIANERNGSPPSVVADAIHAALAAPRPRTRVLVGKHARLLATLAAVLPDRLFDRARLRLFR